MDRFTTTTTSGVILRPALAPITVTITSGSIAISPATPSTTLTTLLQRMKCCLSQLTHSCGTTSSATFRGYPLIGSIPTSPASSRFWPHQAQHWRPQATSVTPITLNTAATAQFTAHGEIASAIPLFALKCVHLATLLRTSLFHWVWSEF